jgi:hypothetical protein
MRTNVGYFYNQASLEWACQYLMTSVAPLYRYMEKAPRAVFVDYACGVAEIALNWMPDFFLETSFYHDVFHGFVHKCGPVHKSTRHRAFRKVNTSLMEQINAFLQPLRSLLSSKTTKVFLSALTFLFFHFSCFTQLSTLMFWMEIFRKTFNHQKLETQNMLQAAMTRRNE